MNVEPILFLIPLLPFAGFLGLGLAGKRLPRALVGPLACLGPAAAFVIVVQGFLAVRGESAKPLVNALGDWMKVGAATVPLSFTLDHLSGVLCLVVTGIGTLIHVYSIGYMRDDPGYPRFFAYLNFFMAAMLVLALSDNVVLLFLGWEGVGLASYLLIGFWYEEEANVSAGRKAFVVNRIGDFAFVLGVFLILQHFGSVRFSEILARLAAPGFVEEHRGGLTAIALLLFAGATGKSAQIPLFVWLPDAMAGPTPVSALIHAATMVTSGVYLLARLSPLYLAVPVTLEVVAMVGALTAFSAGFIALSQFDIKKVLAYSTVSQLGYMFVAAGVGLSEAAVFHLVTHAFFKALLFLGAGAVIYSLHHEQDLRKMGGLRKTLPKTFAVFLAGSLAIAGFPGFSGFFSKDEILHGAAEKAFHQGGPVWWTVWVLGVVTAAMTAFYTFRLVAMAFFGAPRWKEAGSEATHHGGAGDRHGHGKDGHGHRSAAPQDAPWVMLVPLYILASLSIIGGLIDVPAFLGHEGGKADGLTYLTYGISFAAFAGGLFLAWRFYGGASTAREALLRGPVASALHRLSAGKLFVDEIYGAVIVKPLSALSQILYYLVDRILIDTILVEGIGGLVSLCAALLRRVQSGRVPGYAAWLIAGAVALLAAAALAARN